MEDRLEPLLTAHPWAMSPDEVIADLDQLIPWLAQAEAALLARIHELDSHHTARHHGATSTAIWLRNRYRIALPTARRYVRLATAIDTAPPPVQDAISAAEITLDQADTIIRALTALPRNTDTDTRTRAAKELIRLADNLDPDQLAIIGQRILHLVAPDEADDADRQALERAEAKARDGRGLTITPDPHGHGYRITGHLTNEGAATIRAAIDPLCHPARKHDTTEPTDEPPGTAASQATNEATGGATNEAAGGAANGATGGAAPKDPRTATQRRADALIEVCRLALNTTELPRTGGDRPQIALTIPYNLLEHQLGTGTLDNGDRITPETARRLACDSRLLPIVIDGAGQPLDVGRTRRLVTTTLRQALTVRDRGCSFPDCDRSQRWTDAHHIVPWAAGGPTSLPNLALLCNAHHTLIHEPDSWTIHIATDGYPTFTPPRHVDPQQKPQRNRYHQRE